MFYAILNFQKFPSIKLNSELTELLRYHYMNTLELQQEEEKTETQENVSCFIKNEYEDPLILNYLNYISYDENNNLNDI